MKPMSVGRSGTEAMSPTGAVTPAGKSPGDRRTASRVCGKQARLQPVEVAQAEAAA